jgi:hypothetical protein
MRFLDHTQRHNTVGRTPLDVRSARRKDLYLTTHNIHDRQTSMPLCGIRTHNPNKWAAVYLRLRPRGHWDRQEALKIFSNINRFLLIKYFFFTCELFARMQLALCQSHKNAGFVWAWVWSCMNEPICWYKEIVVIYWWKYSTRDSANLMGVKTKRVYETMGTPEYSFRIFVNCGAC